MNSSHAVSIERNSQQQNEDRIFHRTKMQRERILNQLREKGLRITKQRLLVIDIILENECSCCKEIFYKASLVDNNIGIATVYRLLNSLEEIGAISRKNMYKVADTENCFAKAGLDEIENHFSNRNIIENRCTVILDDETTYHISTQKWKDIIKAGLETYGYIKNQNVLSVTVSRSLT